MPEGVLEGRGSCSAMRLSWLHVLFCNTELSGFIMANSKELWLSQGQSSQCGVAAVKWQLTFNVVKSKVKHMGGK